MTPKGGGTSYQNPSAFRRLRRIFRLAGSLTPYGAVDSLHAPNPSFDPIAASLRGVMASRLGELLVRENLISLQQLQKAQEEQRKAGGRLGVQLTKLGFIEETDLTNFLSKQYGVPSINLSEFEIDSEISKLVPKEVAEKHLVIPVNRAGSSLIVAMSDPSNIYAIDDLKFVTGYNI